MFSTRPGIVPESAGRGAFGWLLVAVVSATVVFALSLQFIIGCLRRILKAIDRHVFSVITGTAAAPQNTIPAVKSQIRGRRLNHSSQNSDVERGASDL